MPNMVCSVTDRSSTTTEKGSLSQTALSVAWWLLIICIIACLLHLTTLEQKLKLEAQAANNQKGQCPFAVRKFCSKFQVLPLVLQKSILESICYSFIGHG